VSVEYFFAVDAPTLHPLGMCANCGAHEDPMIAVFWRADEVGNGICPKCSGDAATEGYDFVVRVLRSDLPLVPAALLGPYSAAEARRTADYLAKLENVKSANVAPKPEWF
jgi:hypothetical protein